MEAKFLDKPFGASVIFYEADIQVDIILGNSWMVEEGVGISPHLGVLALLSSSFYYMGAVLPKEGIGIGRREKALLGERERVLVKFRERLSAEVWCYKG